VMLDSRQAHHRRPRGIHFVISATSPDIHRWIEA
jgi:hypothetical protein